MTKPRVYFSSLTFQFLSPLQAKASGKKLQKVTLKISPRGIILYDSASNQLIENISIYRWAIHLHSLTFWPSTLFQDVFPPWVSHQASHFETLHFSRPQNLHWNGEGKVDIGPAGRIHHRGKRQWQPGGLLAEWLTTMVAHLNLANTHTPTLCPPTPTPSHIKYLKPATACALEAVWTPPALSLWARLEGLKIFSRISYVWVQERWGSPSFSQASVGLCAE